MKTFLDCIPCLLKQTLAASRIATQDIAIQKEIMKQSLTKLSTLSSENSPPILCYELNNIVSMLSHNPDPYKEEKQFFNNLVLKHYDYFESLIQSSANQLEASARLSILGNIIDFGAYHQRADINLLDSIEKNLHTPLSIDNFDQFQHAIKEAKRILIFGDNAGEIVLDTFLVKAIGKERVTYVVRGKPIINDATFVDAQASGMTELCNVVENNLGFPGTVFEQLSEQLQNDFHNADVVIAKGQGNFETMCELKHKALFFLLMVKCPVLANHIGCEKDTMALYKQNNDYLD